MIITQNRLIRPAVPNLKFNSKLKNHDLSLAHNYTMGKKTGLSRPKATKTSKLKFTQKKTHNQKTSTLVYPNGNQTSPKSKNSDTAIYYEDSEDPPSSQTKSSELRKA